MTTEEANEQVEAANSDGPVVTDQAPATTVPAVNAETTASETPKESGSVQANVPQFSSLGASAENITASSMSRFLDVSVQVSAELGSIKIPIGELLQLGEGSVLELNRSLSEPVDLVAQGVRIAKGEVVVIDDCFAIRIKEIEPNNAT